MQRAITNLLAKHYLVSSILTVILLVAAILSLLPFFAEEWADLAHQ